MRDASQSVSIIVPCYNEEDALPTLTTDLADVVAQLATLSDVEVLFVDDGSTDTTPEILAGALVSLPARVLTHERNRGITAAFRTGFAAARGAILCTIDADGTFDPLRLPTLISCLETSGADIVTASQHHPQGGMQGVPWWRRALSRGASWLYRCLLPVKLYSYTACFRVFRASAARRLRFDHPGFLGITEMLVSAIDQGMMIVEVPMVLTRRTVGVSKMRSLHVAMDHLRFMGWLVVRRVR